MRALNNPNRDNVVAVLFAWQDVQSARVPDAQMVAVINDEGRRINPDNVAALDRYGIKAIRWTERDREMALLRS